MTKQEKDKMHFFDRKGCVRVPKPAVLSHSECVTVAALPESLFSMEVQARGHPNQTGPVFCSLCGYRGVWGINMASCVVLWRMVGSGSAPSLTPLRGLGGDFHSWAMKWMIEGNTDCLRADDRVHQQTNSRQQAAAYTRKQRAASLPSCFAFCTMFTAARIYFPVHLWNILKKDSITRSAPRHIEVVLNWRRLKEWKENN